jgi:hypothetical protein
MIFKEPMHAYVATDPINLSAQNTATLYAAVRTRTINRDNNGITLTSSTQNIDKMWKVVTLSSP